MKAAASVTEDQVELAIRRTAEAVGIVVMKRSQGFRGVFDPEGKRADGGVGKWVPSRGGTRQTEGLSDLELWIPANPGLACPFVVGFWETKTEQGLRDYERLRQLDRAQMERQCPSRAKDWHRVQGQMRYEALCRLAGAPYGRGGLAEFLRWLIPLGLAQEGKQGGHAPLLVRARRDALEQLAQVVRDLRLAP